MYVYGVCGFIALMPVCVNYYILLFGIIDEGKAIYVQAFVEELA